MSRPDPSPIPVPRWMLVGILAACALAAYYLLPSRRDLLDRQVKDGAYQQALHSLQKLSARDRAADPRYFALLELRLLRQGLPRNPGPALRPVFDQALTVGLQFGQAQDFLNEVLALIPLAPSAAQAHEWLQPRLVSFQPPAQRAIYEAVVARALAANDPLGAAELYALYWRLHAGEEAATTRMIQLCRQAGRVDRALAAIQAWAAGLGRPLPQVSPAIARARVDLLREAALPLEAFEAARELAQPGGAAIPEPLFQLLVVTAREANRAADILPEVKRRTEAGRGDASSWRLYAELALAAGKLDWAVAARQHLVELDPSGTNHFLLGQVLEWTGRPGEAFGAYLKALDQQVPPALGRLLALNPGLYRDAELAAALSQQQDLLFATGHGLELARIQAHAGEFVPAAQTYDRLLAQGPGNAELLAEAGRLQMDLFEYEKALALLTKGGVGARDRETELAIAECLFRLSRYDEALAAYERLMKAAPEEDVLDKYITLAESLGQLEKVTAGLESKVAATHAPPAQDYQRLAYFYTQRNLHADARRVLSAGLKRHPGDPALQLQTAYALAGEKRWVEAARALEGHPELRTQPEIITFYLGLLLLAQRYQEASAFLRGPLNPAATNTVEYLDAAAQAYEGDRALSAAAAIYGRLAQREPAKPRYALNQARLLAELGQTKRAEALLRPLLEHDSPEVWKLAAQVQAAAGHQRLAENYQRRYLATAPADLPKEWGFLGDVLLSQGDRTNAKRAYRRGLNLLLEQAQPRLPQSPDASR